MEIKTITVFDTETTGLLPRKGANLVLYPHIVEVCALQFDTKTDEILKEVSTFVKSPMPISPGAFRVNQITEDMLKDAPVFSEVLKPLRKAFDGSQIAVAANIMFDTNVIEAEFKRLEEPTFFTKELQRFCVIQQSMHLKGYRLKNTELYEMDTGKQLTGAHRAKADCLATYEIYKWLRRL